jgi:hypothetical protein
MNFHWFTFTQEIENNDKLNKFLFIFHYLTKIKLLSKTIVVNN